MRAVVVRKFGPPSVLAVVDDQPKPSRKAGEVLVEVHATSVNPIDCKVLGRDFAGEVVEADRNSPLRPGSRVFSFTDWSGVKIRRSREGAYAEYISVPEAQLATMPSNSSYEQAAALALVSITAWQALEEAALQPGQHVLIHAGAGGVGSIAVQLAKARGLHVTTTCSTRNLAFVKQELGADEAVDYTEQRFEAVYRDQPFDGVIDVVGGDYETRSLSVVKRDGVYVSIANSGWMQKYGRALGAAMMLYSLAKGKLLRALRWGPRYYLLMVRPDGAQLAAVARLVEDGRVKPIVDRVLPLDRVSEAHEYVEQGHARGKVVLRVKDG